MAEATGKIALKSDNPGCLEPPNCIESEETSFLHILSSIKIREQALYFYFLQSVRKASLSFALF